MRPVRHPLHRAQPRGRCSGSFPLFRRAAAALLMSGIALDLFGLRGLALAGFRSSGLDDFRINSPVEGQTLGDGNLVRIEGIGTGPSDGRVDNVEVSFDETDTWWPVHADVADPMQWSYVWTDPTPGPHLIRARAFGVD